MSPFRLAVRNASAEIVSLSRLAAPLVSGLVVATGIGIVDTAMLGPLGAVPLAAVSLASSVLVIFYAGLYGFTGPSGIFAGQAEGAGDAPAIGRVARHALLLALAGGVLGAVSMAALLLLLPAMGQPPEVLDVIAPYWLWMAVMLLPYTIVMAAKQVLDATHRAWQGVFFTALPILFNVFLNWVLIYGNLGAPALGLTGAGLASFLAQMLGMGLIVAYLRYAPSVASWWTESRLSKQSFSEQLREGLPMSLGYFAEGGAVAVAGLLVGLVGTVALAGNQIAMAVGSTLYMLPLGMSAAVTIRVAQAVGAGERLRVAAIGLPDLVLFHCGWGCSHFSISRRVNGSAASLSMMPQ